VTTEEDRTPLPSEIKAAKSEVSTRAQPSLVHFRLFEQLKQRNVIRVAALYLVVCWLILEPVHVVFHMLDVPVWANRLVLMLMAVGFPAVVIFAWVYEVTPEGLKPTAEVPHGQSIRRLTGRRLDRAIIAVLAVALAYFVVDKFWLSKRVTTSAASTTVSARARSQSFAVPAKSIAVLPFADMSEKHDQEYFADGMAEEVIDLLANIPGLRVIGRTSSFQFKGKNQDLRAIGNALGVSYVVEGSVRKAGERLRVTAQLISAQDGSHLWSHTYDASVGDALNVQDEIASNLVRALEVSVGAAGYHPDRPSFNSTEAYDLYLRGLHAYERYDKEGFEAAAGYFQQVLDLDLRSVPAANWLAQTHLMIAAFGYVDPATGFERTRVSCQRALALDPKSYWALGVLSSVYLIYDWDWAAAERDAKEALRLKPNDPDNNGGLGDVYRTLGRWDDSARLYETAISLDPLTVVWHAHLRTLRYSTGKLHDAEAEARKVLQISPTKDGGHSELGQVLLAQGKLAAALPEMQQEAGSSRDFGLAVIYHAMGQRTESDAALAKFIREHAQDESFAIAQAYGYRGELDQAFTWLERAYRQKDSDLWTIKLAQGDPLLKDFAHDPRFAAFLRKMNLPE